MPLRIVIISVKSNLVGLTHYTAQKKKLKSKVKSIKDVFNIWSHLLEKSLMENFIFCAVLLSETLSFHKNEF